MRKKLVEVLEYQLEYGANAEEIARQHELNGLPVPSHLTNAPELLPGLELYLMAFFDLDTERNHGMGIVAIPWSSIAKYSEFYEFDQEQTDNLFYFIRRLDDANMQHIQRLRETESRNAKRSAKPRK